MNDMMVSFPRRFKEKDGGAPFVPGRSCPPKPGLVAPSRIHGVGVFAMDRIQKGTVFDMPAGHHTGFNNQRLGNTMLVRVRTGAHTWHVCMLAVRDIDPLDEVTLRLRPWPGKRLA